MQVRTHWQREAAFSAIFSTILFPEMPLWAGMLMKVFVLDRVEISVCVWLTRGCGELIFDTAEKAARKYEAIRADWISWWRFRRRCTGR